jgi:hypothetical protein
MIKEFRRPGQEKPGYPGDVSIVAKKQKNLPGFGNFFLFSQVLYLLIRLFSVFQCLRSVLAALMMRQLLNWDGFVLKNIATGSIYFVIL